MRIVPTVWIELGGQLEHVTTGRESLLRPPFLAANPDVSRLAAGVAVCRRRNRSAFQHRRAKARFHSSRKDSDWVFSAPSATAGRAASDMSIIRQTECITYQILGAFRYGSPIRHRTNFADTTGTTVGKPCHSRFSGGQGCRARNVRQKTRRPSESRRSLRAVRVQSDVRSSARGRICISNIFDVCALLRR